MMKKPKPRHIKKEIAKQVRAIQIQMGLTPRQMRALSALNHCQTASRLSMVSPHFGVNPQSTPEERAERFRRSMPEGYNKQEDAREHGNIIDRTSHPVVNRPNPIREHWERFGDPYEGRLPVKDIDHTLLAIKPTPEMKADMARVKDNLKTIFVDGVRVDDPEEGK